MHRNQPIFLIPLNFLHIDMKKASVALEKHLKSIHNKILISYSFFVLTLAHD